MTVEEAASGGSAVPAQAEPARRGVWTDRSPHPWRRLGARMIDIQLVGVLIGLTYGAAHVWGAEDVGRVLMPFRGEYGSVLDGWLISVWAAPFNALFVGLTGSTFGKWVFGVRVVRSDGRPVGVLRAFVREILVLVMGLGLNLPLISLVTMGMSYGTLEDRRATNWDRVQRNSVLHRPSGFWQGLLTFLGVVLLVGVAGYSWWVQFSAMAKT
jgi:uncharacterized RDD family membrane protein YckC